MDGPPIENGAVAVGENRIVEAGKFSEIKSHHGGPVLDLGEQVLLPGLINAHCHLDYTSLRGLIPPPSSFADWIRAINARKGELSEADYVASIASGLVEAQSFGTTSVVNLEAFPELIPRLPETPLRIWWCAEMIDVRKNLSARETLEELRTAVRSRPESRGGPGLAPHAPYTASAGLYSEAAKLAESEDLLLTTHLAESREEMLMFRDGHGPLSEFLRSIGRSMDDCGRATPFASFSRSQTLNNRWIIAHLNELTEEDFDLLARSEKFHIVHCPRSHTFFGHAPFEFGRLRALGFNICLGTDSLASNSSLSLFSEMREMVNKQPVSPREALEMVTINAARALREQDSLGRIRAGFRADLIAVPHSEEVSQVFEGIVAFDRSVPWIMIDGEVAD